MEETMRRLLPAAFAALVTATLPIAAFADDAPAVLVKPRNSNNIELMVVRKCHLLHVGALVPADKAMCDAPAGAKKGEDCTCLGDRGDRLPGIVQ
jgi:hypothetical protein